MSKYPPADSTTQWFQDRFPGATMNLTAATTVLVLHTTEGTTWPDYQGGSEAPTYTAHPLISQKRVEWRQHFPDEKSARALVNLPGGVETNTLNAVQVEMIGTCDPIHRTSWGTLRAGSDYIFWPDAPDWALRAIGDFVAYLSKQHGLRFVAPTFLPYPASSGANGVRFTGASWSAFAGICGHQHVPENTHGDPGNLDIAKVIVFAKGVVDPTPTPPPSPVTRFPRRKVGHPRPGKPEYTGDSYRGIAAAVRGKCKAVDLNILPTKDFVDVAVEHYPLPLRHGFHDKAGKLHPDTALDSMVWLEVARLETKDTPPYTIHKAEDLFAHALEVGLDVEGDLKAPIPAWRLRHLLNALPHPERVIFKTMATAGPEAAPWERLKAAHDAGAQTLILCHRPLVKIPKDAQHYIDFYRGFKPRWV